jgi:hypothetical protein
MESDGPAHIEYFSTKDLLKEVQKRFDDVLFVGYMNKTTDNDHYTFFFKGSCHGVVGLADMVKRVMEDTNEHNHSD